MSEVKIIVGEKIFRPHPKYRLFAADSCGSVITIPSFEHVDCDNEGNILVKSLTARRRHSHSKIVFIWECFRGLKNKDEIVCRVNDDLANDEIINLKLVKIVKTRTKLSPEERSKRNAECMARWRNRVWVCPDCGFRTTNNASRHHKRMCKFTANPYSEDEKQRIKDNNDRWKNGRFICELCHNVYSNNYRCIHMRICRKKHHDLE